MPEYVRWSFFASQVVRGTHDLLGDSWMLHREQDSGAYLLCSHAGVRVKVTEVERVLSASVTLATGKETYYNRRSERTPSDAAESLASMIQEEIVPQHEEFCPVQAGLRTVLSTLPNRHAVDWRYGTCFVTLRPARGGLCMVQIDPSPDQRIAGLLCGRSTTITTQMRALTVEQAEAVLRSLDTSNEDPRRHTAVHGSLAQRLKAAAPGLRPTGDHTWPSSTGPRTVALKVDRLVSVRICDEEGMRPVRIDVAGDLGTQLAALQAA